MDKKSTQVIVLFSAFCFLDYFLYRIISNTKLGSIYANEFLLFFIAIILMVTLFGLFYLDKKDKKLSLTLAKNLEEKDKQLKHLHKNFQDKLNKAIHNNKTKHQTFYEELKISSMNDLITNIAHQWRQPLSVISVAATSIQLHEKANTVQLKHIINHCNLIYENAQYLSNIIDNFSHPSQKKVLKKRFKMKKTIKNLWDLTHHLNVQIIYEEKEEIVLNSYKNKILQVLLNLIHNTYECFEKRQCETRKIYIEAFYENDEVILIIKDTAQGIESHIIHRVFEPYFTTKHQAQGVGLGLYITYTTVTQKLQGRIQVCNTHFLDKETKEIYTGAMFTIALPRGEEKENRN